MKQLPNKKYRASYEIFLDLNKFIFLTPNFLISFYKKYGYDYPTRRTLESWIQGNRNKVSRKARQDNILKLMESGYVDNLLIV